MEYGPHPAPLSFTALDDLLMITLDLVAIVISIIGLLSGFIAFLQYVGQRPTRAEMNDAISLQMAAVATSIDTLHDDIKGLREDIKSLWGRRNE